MSQLHEQPVEETVEQTAAAYDDQWAHAYPTLRRTMRRVTLVALCGYVDPDPDDGDLTGAVPADHCPICLAVLKSKRGGA